MKITISGDTLNVSQIAELATATANSFQSALNAALPASVRRIEIDFSDTDFVDCGGLGALVAFRNSARRCNGEVAIRLLNPPQPMQRMMSLMHMEDTFPVDHRDNETAQNQETALVE
jgi:anti-anti-sigma factor